ncbi:hypothetical protein [Actinoalloteichus fjordicus]|uniref:hypothetical protein n=1 Tax=Actinoalloteichus fjordicus TaxID=1612552 RepID=UPI0012FA15AC|nr:hypothetical protein [Actinoalloteichus fjordicus]
MDSPLMLAARAACVVVGLAFGDEPAVALDIAKNGFQFLAGVAWAAAARGGQDVGRAHIGRVACGDVLVGGGWRVEVMVLKTWTSASL